MNIVGNGGPNAWEQNGEGKDTSSFEGTCWACGRLGLRSPAFWPSQGNDKSKGKSEVRLRGEKSARAKGSD